MVTLDFTLITQRLFLMEFKVYFLNILHILNSSNSGDFRFNKNDEPASRFASNETVKLEPDLTKNIHKI